MEISERIQLIIKSHNLTASTFAEEVGIQRSSVSHLLAGRNKPSLDVLEKILNHFPRVDAAWLITGKQSGNKDALSEKQSISNLKSEATTTDVAAKSTEHQKVTPKQPEAIVKFYNDGTFETYYPKN